MQSLSKRERNRQIRAISITNCGIDSKNGDVKETVMTSLNDNDEAPGAWSDDESIDSDASDSEEGTEISWEKPSSDLINFQSLKKGQNSESIFSNQPTRVMCEIERRRAILN